MMSSSWRVQLANEEVVERFLANVDVWQTIFEMLPMKDRIRLEMTNKRLHILTFECWKRVTSFDTEFITEISHNSSMNNNRENLSAAFVAICVSRIGDGLRSLTMREKHISMVVWSDNLRSIAEACPNVETINFVIESECKTLDVHFDSFSRLKTLTVSSTDGGFPEASASVFLSIPTSIEVIRGLSGHREEPFENAAQVEGFFADRSSLREVHLGDLHTRDRSKADIFRVIAERCPKLKSIKLLDSNYSYCIDYSGVIVLESMKQLCIPNFGIDEMEIVRICERSPLVEALQFRLLDLQSAALHAVGALTKLRELCLYTRYAHAYFVTPSLFTEFVRDLARNSGASLRHLDLGMPLPTAAIEALANGCGKLRYVQFYVRVGEVTPASIRFLIDCIVAHPSWILQTPSQGTLVMVIRVVYNYLGDAGAVMATAFEALAAPAAGWPAGVELRMC